ncbi:hypothetical protein [Streptomyces winkii]|uniref:hypothetical protein n=1 Tax=Streptomyces winkii TaxID=3051178 RepID=UPI0028D31B6B|nr:hypothetical protein [Streptomyces sp. DSM 40971]
MFSRFNVAPILRGHWKGLSDGEYSKWRPDRTSRALLVAPAAVFLFMLSSDGVLKSPTPLLTGVALLAGGMLSAFTHLSALRLKITEWNIERDTPEFSTEKDSLDESAAHLLAGALVCILDAATLVIGMNIALRKDGALTGFWAALASGLSAYVFLVFVAILPKLYSAYVDINRVKGELSGFTKSLH